MVEPAEASRRRHTLLSFEDHREQRFRRHLCRRGYCCLGRPALRAMQDWGRLLRVRDKLRLLIVHVKAYTQYIVR